MATLQGTGRTAEARLLLKRELQGSIEIEHESEIGLFSATPPEFVRLIVDTGEWLLDNAAGELVGIAVAAGWAKRKELWTSLKDGALRPIRLVVDALQKAKEEAPSHAGFSIGLRSHHGGPEVRLALPLEDREETIRLLVLFHLHRARIESTLDDWFTRGDHWALASLHFADDGSGTLRILKTGDEYATPIHLPVPN